ncbi:hypothetical protein Pmar_PMAR018059, partial [Perkinsus marinus ATCC 50983]
SLREILLLILTRSLRRTNLYGGSGNHLVTRLVAPLYACRYDKYLDSNASSKHGMSSSDKIWRCSRADSPTL